MKMDQQTKRVQAFPPTRPQNLKQAALSASGPPLSTTLSGTRTATSASKGDSLTSKVRQQMAGREKCEKHRAYKVAFDADSNSLMCNQCLFEQQLAKSGPSKPEQLEFNQHHMFTALMTRDLKNKFDSFYKGYKDGLCDVAEIDHDHVK